MIEYIKGTLAEKTPTHAVIDCNGLAYLINISLNTFSQLGNEKGCKLFTHLVIREDAHTLYGFHDKYEREIFRHLISVSGVGANTARMMLSSLGPDEIQKAIIQENVGMLKGIKGIGAKTAERIIVDLKDKVAKASTGDINTVAGMDTTREEALSALTMLGFSKGIAEKALSKVISASNDKLSVEDMVKATLKHL